MKSEVLPHNAPKTDVEYQQEAHRLIGEIREMLADSQRSMERATRIGQKNRQAIEQLRQQLSGEIDRLVPSALGFGRQLREQGAAIENLEEKTEHLIEIVQVLNVEKSTFARTVKILPLQNSCGAHFG